MHFDNRLLTWQHYRGDSGQKQVTNTQVILKSRIIQLMVKFKKIYIFNHKDVIN